MHATLAEKPVSLGGKANSPGIILAERSRETRRKCGGENFAELRRFAGGLAKRGMVLAF
jgi:hypothetical protein